MPSFYLMVPECTSNNVGNSHIPKRSHKTLPLRRKVKVLTVKKKEKLYTEIAKIYGKNESSVC
jgi:hypothetical protein